MTYLFALAGLRSDGRCCSCDCSIAPEGYCGCEPDEDPVLQDQRCRARTYLLGRYPCGPCECAHPSCHTCGIVPGPAALLVVREGREVRVCTRCKLSDDQTAEVLVRPDTPLSPFSAWDNWGASLLALGWGWPNAPTETQEE